MFLPIFLFEVSDKIPTIEQFYIGGIIWAVFIFAAACFNRWLGLIFLFVALIFATQSISDGLGADIIKAVIEEMGDNYVKHWNYSIVFSVVLEVLAFISGIAFKKFYLKRKINLDLK